MKNSAWYHKIWLNKFDKLPLKSDADTSWTNMKGMLDQQLPVSHTSNGHTANSKAAINQATKTIGAKLVTILGYVLPAAAIIAAVTYVTLPPAHQKNIISINKQQQLHTAPVIKENSKDTLVMNNNQQNPELNKDSIFSLPGIPLAVTKNFTFPLHNDSDHTVKTVDETDANPKVHLNQNPTGQQMYSGIFRSTKTNSKTPVNNRLTKQDNSLAPSSGNPSPLTPSVETNSAGDKITAAGKAVRQGGINDTYQTGIIRTPDKIQIDTSLNPTGNSGNQSVSITTEASTNSSSSAKLQAAQTNNQTLTVAKANSNNQNSSRFKTGRTRAIGNKGGKNNTPKSLLVNDGQDISSPEYNFSLEAGINTGGTDKHTFYFGMDATYALNQRWLLNAGFRINTPRVISGSYTHTTDSAATFTVIDSRKILTADVPVTLEYRISKALSLKLGPVISIPVKQSDVNTSIGQITNPRDTIYLSKEINKALNNTTLNKVNLGITGGISIRIRQFNIEGKYQALKPYQLSNGLGSYHKSYQSFNLGIGYRFN